LSEVCIEENENTVGSFYDEGKGWNILFESETFAVVNASVSM
jgi:hypothetical protein